MILLTADCNRRHTSLIALVMVMSVPFVASNAQDNLPSKSDLLSPLGPVEHPQDNPASPAKIALGRELFFDARLSRNNHISCASCHDPEKGFSNAEQFATGIDRQPGKRHVPSLINVGYSQPLFWDGRAQTLEAQALLPIKNPAEMDMDLDVLVKKLSGVPAYRMQFERVFRGPVTAKRIGKALAAYERTIISNNTPFDRYLRGNQKSLTTRAKRGMTLFFGRARCSLCHKGSELTDNEFHNIGSLDPNLPQDPGRRAVTGDAEDEGAFRTPQLREIARTAPYMHNGKFQTLKEVVQHYNFGGVTEQENDHRDEILEVLYLSEDEVDDLVAFLKEGLSSPPETNEKKQR